MSEKQGTIDWISAAASRLKEAGIALTATAALFTMEMKEVLTQDKKAPQAIEKLDIKALHPQQREKLLLEMADDRFPIRDAADSALEKNVHPHKDPGTVKEVYAVGHTGKLVKRPEDPRDKTDLEIVMRTRKMFDDSLKAERPKYDTHNPNTQYPWIAGPPKGETLPPGMMPKTWGLYVQLSWSSTTGAAGAGKDFPSRPLFT